MSLDDDDMAENDFVEARSILDECMLPRLWMNVLSIIRFAAAAAAEDEADDRMVEKAIIG